MIAEPGYRILASVLNDALNQAQYGKGKERHAAGESFDQQEICANTRAVGFGYPLGQARKKAREAKRLLRDRGKDAAIAECLGAINYLAAAVIVMKEQGQETEAAWADRIFEQAAAMSNEVCPYCGEESKHCDCDVMFKPPKHNRKRGKVIFGDHSERTAAQGVEDMIRWRQRNIPDHTCTKEEDEAQNEEKLARKKFDKKIFEAMDERFTAEKLEKIIQQIMDQDTDQEYQVVFDPLTGERLGFVTNGKGGKHIYVGSPEEYGIDEDNYRHQSFTDEEPEHLFRRHKTASDYLGTADLQKRNTELQKQNTELVEENRRLRRKLLGLGYLEGSIDGGGACNG